MPKGYFSGGATGLGVFIGNAAGEQVDGQAWGSTPRAVVPTVAGLTTGLLLASDAGLLVEATSANSAHFITLPAATAATRGRKIRVLAAGATALKAKTPASPAGGTINNVDASGGSVGAIMTAGNEYEFEQTLANGWTMTGKTNLGAVQTAVVPA